MDRSSPYGGLFFVVAVLAIALGLMAHSSALVGLGLAWLSLFAVGRLAAWRAIRFIEANRRLPGGALENDVVTVDVVVENHGQVPASYILVSDSFGAGTSDQQEVLEPGPLPAKHRRLSSYRAFVARQWGTYTVGPLSICAWDPLGLTHAENKLPGIDVFEVYPRPVSLEELAGTGAHMTMAPRGPTEAAAGQSLIFRGVREFRPGDDVRRIHWPATARRGLPMVRETERDVEPIFTLVLDLDKRGRGGIGRQSALEQLVRTATSLLFEAHQQGHAVQIVGEGERSFFLPAGRSEEHLAGALHALVSVQQDGTTPLPEVVERYRPLLPPGTTMTLIGANMEVDLDSLEASLRALRAASVACMAVYVDSLTFTPFDRRPVPVAVATAHREAMRARFRDLDVPLVILRADSTPQMVLDHAVLSPAEM